MDVLVIKVNAFLKTRELNDIRRYILHQKETGVVVLPNYCEAIVIPDDVEIKVEDLSGEREGV